MRHYHIKHDEEKYFISDKHRFPTIKDLIEYHKLNGGGLVTRLRKPPQQLLPQLNTLSPLFGGCGLVGVVSVWMRGVVRLNFLLSQHTTLRWVCSCGHGLVGWEGLG